MGILVNQNQIGGGQDNIPTLDGTNKFTGNNSFQSTLPNSITIVAEQFDAHATSLDSPNYGGIIFNDKNGDRLSKLELYQSVNGIHNISLNTCYYPEDGEVEYSTLQIGFDSQHKPEVALNFDPEPTSNYRHVATTGWVNSRIDTVIGDYVVYYDSANTTDHSHKHPNIATPTDNRWYRIYKSGWCEQGGKWSLSGNYTTGNQPATTLQFLVKMADTNYNVSCARTATNGMFLPTIYDTFTVNSMRAINYVIGTSTDVSERYRICGYSDV